MKLNVNIKPHRQETVTISTPFIRLDALLKFKGEAETGGQAKELIHEGLVQVGGQVCLLRGKKLRPGDRVRVALDPPLLLEVEAEAHAG